MTAQIKGFDTRAELKMRPPKSISRNINPSLGGVAAHYGGSGPNPVPTTHDKCQDTWRGWQNYHMDTHGWADIAYTSGFCNHGIVLAGRGYGIRTAANGTNDANYKYYAFVWIGGGSAEPNQLAYDALDWLVNDARKNGGAGPVVAPHSEFYATSCAGKFISPYARSLSGKPVTLPVGLQPTPIVVKPVVHKPAQIPFPLPTKPRLHWFGRNDGTAYSHSGYYAKDRPYILRLQQALLKAGFNPHGVDGYFGDKTAAALIRYQRSKGLLADGKAGPQSWNSLI